MFLFLRNTVTKNFPSQFSCNHDCNLDHRWRICTSNRVARSTNCSSNTWISQLPTRTQPICPNVTNWYELTLWINWWMERTGAWRITWTSKWRQRWRGDEFSLKSLRAKCPKANFVASVAWFSLIAKIVDGWHVGTLVAVYARIWRKKGNKHKQKTVLFLNCVMIIYLYNEL